MVASSVFEEIAVRRPSTLLSAKCFAVATALR
jgi:hypothetical protein